MPLLAKKVTWLLIGAAFEFAGHDIGEQGEVAGENIDLGIGDSFDFLRVAGDHGGFAADAHLPSSRFFVGAAHLDDQIGLLDDLRVPFVRFDAGEMHAGFDQRGIIDDDLDGIGAGGDDVRSRARRLRGCSTGMILMPSFSLISAA